MKNKIIIILMLLLALVSLAAVSAADNSTDDTFTQSSVEVNSSDVSVASASDSNDDVKTNGSSSKQSSEIQTSKVEGYTSFSNNITAKLTSNGQALSSKTVTVLINNVNYTKTTDSDGKVCVSVELPKGTYTAVFNFAGDDETNPSSATAEITIKDAKKTKLKVGDKYINYRQGSKCLFYVKLTTSAGKAIKGQWVTIKVNGKTYKVKTNKNGNAKIYLNLKKGTYKIKYSFKKNSPYLSSSGSFKIKVKKKMAKGNGYWVWSSHMKKVNLKSIAKKGTKHILLHVHSIALHGKSAVVSFIKKAHKYKMKVHLWMQVCYSNGKWVRPIDSHNKIKYSFLNKKIKEAKRYAKIKGVDGIHFDYVRFGGSAHLYKDPNRAINYFSKKVSTAIHKIKPNCIVSAAIMPEPSAMTYYYGQDVSTMSKYMDVLIPMVYKGNYHQTNKWIKSVTKTFVGQSNGAQIWTGLQSYHSDNNAKKLSQKELRKDAKSAISGGAKGVMLFRFGISCNFNFKKV